MKNVSMTVHGNVLTITVNLNINHGLSGSGKSQVIASTEGNVSVKGHEEIKIGLNVYKPIR